VRTTIHVLGATQTAGTGGVSDYTSLLTSGLARRGAAVRSWDTAAADVRAELAAALMSQPGRLLVQYVPNAFGRRGANVAFCLWLLALRRRGVDVQVMFHEPYMYFSWHRPLQSALAAIQRAMAAILLRASPVSYVSTERWQRYLAPLAPRRNRFVVVPIPSTVPHESRPEATAQWRRRLAPDARLIGHFGTYGAHVRSELAPIVTRLLHDRPDVRVVCLGRGSDQFAAGLDARESVLAGRITGTGALDGQGIADVLRACDVIVQPYPDGVTTRRTSVMAAVACGAATVTSRGFLTEPVWDASGAVRLAAASDAPAHATACARLLSDEPDRRALAARAAEAYDLHFSMERTLDTLLSEGAPV
jgi:glycosyltransferase involved in cell wall biosynthesis